MKDSQEWLSFFEQKSHNIFYKVVKKYENFKSLTSLKYLVYIL